MAYLKFRQDSDKLKFLIEVNRLDLLDTDPSDFGKDLYEAFIKKRKLAVLGLKDFRKSQQAKASWRKNRWHYLTGIRGFHRSIAGKRLHRSMSRFLMTRIFEPNKLKHMSQLQGEALTGISSIRTHFYIESQYYMTLNEEVEFKMLLEYAMPLLIDVERKIYESKLDDITDEELELLIRIVEKKELYKPIQSLKGQSFVEEFKKLEEEEDSSLKYMSFINNKN